MSNDIPEYLSRRNKYSVFSNKILHTLEIDVYPVVWTIYRIKYAGVLDWIWWLWGTQMWPVL